MYVYCTDKVPSSPSLDKDECEVCVPLDGHFYDISPFTRGKGTYEEVQKRKRRYKSVYEELLSCDRSLPGPANQHSESKIKKNATNLCALDAFLKQMCLQYLIISKSWLF